MAFPAPGGDEAGRSGRAAPEPEPEQEWNVGRWTGELRQLEPGPTGKEAQHQEQRQTAHGRPCDDDSAGGLGRAFQRDHDGREKNRSQHVINSQTRATNVSQIFIAVHLDGRPTRRLAPRSSLRADRVPGACRCDSMGAHEVLVHCSIETLSRKRPANFETSLRSTRG